MSVSWGILATGNIAHKLASDLSLVPGHRLGAVGSRTAASAEAFVREHGDADTRAHDSYEELAADPDVDVVYVATPHSRHAEDVRLCLAAGKHVLCEKPLTLDAESARALVQEARAAGLLLAEAMWMRTNPAIRRTVELVGDGVIGTVRQVRADLGFVGPRDRERLWRPELGASALLDLGIYPLTFANLVLGPPERIAAAAHLDANEVDLSGGATLVHAGGAVSNLSWTQEAWSDSRASIAGDVGRIELPPRFHHPDHLDVVVDDVTERIELPRTGHGYSHEIEEIGHCLAEGRTESELLPLAATLDVMDQMDRIRASFASA